MKFKSFLLPLIAISLLSSCTGNDSWKKYYGTPELFLNTCVIRGKCSYYLKDDDKNSKNDINFEIRNLLVAAGEYKVASSSATRPENYFTYENYISPSTAGPNICNMFVYENGIVVIDYKAALARHQYLYFSMDLEKAIEINNIVKSKF